MYGKGRQVNVSVANKRIKEVKRQRNLFLIGTVVCIIVIVFLSMTSLQFAVIHNHYDQEGDENNYYDDYYDDYWETIEFTYVLYVHKDGSNLDGLSWETAFTTLNAALNNASSDLNDVILIIIGPGDYDMNVAGVYIINKNVQLWGVRRNLVTLYNAHVSATGVLLFNKFGGLYNIGVCCGGCAHGCDGITFNSTGSTGSRMYRVIMTCGCLSESCRGLTLTGGTSNFLAEDLHIMGNQANMTAVYLNNSHSNVFRQLYLDNCSIGIHLNHTGDDWNLFRNVNIRDCVTGIDVDSGNQQAFEEIAFLGNTRNIDDEVGDSIWTVITLSNPESSVIPGDLTGILVACGVGANNYGVDTELYAAAAADNPFFAVAIIYEVNATEKYGVRLSADGGVTYFFETVAEIWTAGEVNRMTAEVPYIFNMGSRVSCSIKSESGWDTANIWLQIIEI